MIGTCITLAMALQAPPVLAALVPANQITPERSIAWTQWAGPNRNYQAPSLSLYDKADLGKIRKLWTMPIGDGYAGLCIAGDKVITFSSAGGKEQVRARSLRDGSLHWERSFDVPFANLIDVEFGFGPHATPLVFGETLFCVGTTGRLNALDLRSGDGLWEVQLWESGQATRLERGYASSPVVNGDSVILQVGGVGQSLQCYSLRDGRVRWKRHDFVSSYCSPILVELDGRQHLVALMDQELVSVDPATGELLWNQPVPARSYVHCVSPAVTSDGTIVVNTMAGLRAFRPRLAETGDYRVEQLWSSTTKICQTANLCVVSGNVLGASEAGVFVAVNASTGKVSWKSRALERCSFVYNGNTILAVEETGQVTLAIIENKDLEVIWRARPLTGRNWVGPAVSDGIFAVRDRKNVVVYECIR